MILLVGTEALSRRLGKSPDSEGGIDLITSMPDMIDFVQKNDIDAAPLNKTHFRGVWCGCRVDIEIADPRSSADWLLDIIRGDIMEMMGVKMFIPNYRWLYTLKMSHRFAPNRRGFYKTMSDIFRIRAADPNVAVADAEWLKAREAETYGSSRHDRDMVKRPIMEEAPESCFATGALYEAMKLWVKPAHAYYGWGSSPTNPYPLSWRAACSLRSGHRKLFASLPQRDRHAPGILDGPRIAVHLAQLRHFPRLRVGELPTHHQELRQVVLIAMSISFEDKSRDVDPDDGYSPPGKESYLAIIGDISQGYRAVGPFETFEDAETWLDKHISSEGTWVMNLLDPDAAESLKP
jgi:hypothetical protein